jgi:hypothetical protein
MQAIAADLQNRLPEPVETSSFPAAYAWIDSKVCTTVQHLLALAGLSTHVRSHLAGILTCSVAPGVTLLTRLQELERVCGAKGQVSTAALEAVLQRNATWVSAGAGVYLDSWGVKLPVFRYMMRQAASSPISEAGRLSFNVAYARWMVVREDAITAAAKARAGPDTPEDDVTVWWLYVEAAMGARTNAAARARQGRSDERVHARPRLPGHSRRSTHGHCVICHIRHLRSAYGGQTAGNRGCAATGTGYQGVRCGFAGAAGH